MNVTGLAIIGFIPVVVLIVLWVIIDPEAPQIIENGLNRFCELVLSGGWFKSL